MSSRYEKLLVSYAAWMRIAICAGTRQIGHSFAPAITASEHVAHTHRWPHGTKV